MDTKKENCPCKRIKCKYYGDCKKCREFHSTSKKYPLPVCEQNNKQDKKKN